MLERITCQLAIVAATAWVGALWAIGYLAAPVLFQTLPGDRMLAGVLAGHMFSWVAYLGMACAAYLLVYGLVAEVWRGLRWIVPAMLLLTLAGQFGIQPMMADLKMQAMPGDVMESAWRDRFILWHGVASVLYLAESLLGVWLVVGLRRTAR